MLSMLSPNKKPSVAVNRSREVTYYDPIGTAKTLILNEAPVPVDLMVELEARGIEFEGFKASILGDDQDYPGFHLVS